MKICVNCGQAPKFAFSITVYREGMKMEHKAYTCGCPEDDDMEVADTPQDPPWSEVAEELSLAEEVGRKIGKDGDYYKPKAFGFSWHDGKVQAILRFVGKEPEVDPIEDGFGTLDMEVTLEEGEEEKEEGEAGD